MWTLALGELNVIKIVKVSVLRNVDNAILDNDFLDKVKYKKEWHHAGIFNLQEVKVILTRKSCTLIWLLRATEHVSKHHCPMHSVIYTDQLSDRTEPRSV